MVHKNQGCAGDSAALAPKMVQVSKTDNDSVKQTANCPMPRWKCCTKSNPEGPKHSIFKHSEPESMLQQTRAEIPPRAGFYEKHCFTEPHVAPSGSFFDTCLAASLSK